MQKGLDREGRRVLSQRRLLERDEGDLTEDACQGGRRGLTRKVACQRRGRGLFEKFSRVKMCIVYFLNFLPGLINSVYNMTFFGKNPVISN